MKISELMLAIGDDNIQFQNLDHCIIGLNYSAKKGTKITFGTEQPANLEGPVKLGLVVWLDREAVKAAMLAAAPLAAPSDGGTPKRDPERMAATDLTDAELEAEKARVEALFDAMFTPDFEGHGGSPGEWMVERLDEIATAQKHRAALKGDTDER